MRKIRVRKNQEFIHVTLSEYGEMPLVIGILSKREAIEYMEHLEGVVEQLRSYINE